MAKTSVMIVLTFGDAELSAAISPSGAALSNLQNLLDNDARRDIYYATYEPDQWILDGSTQVLDQPNEVGFVGVNISNSLRNFGGSNPEITFTLDAAVTINQGITLEFSEISDDYCDSVYIEFRNASAVSVHSETFSPDDYKYFCEPSTLPLAAIKFVYVRFLSTSRAYRHARLLGIYIDGWMLQGDEIQNASILSEIDPVSIELPMNELDFQVYSKSGDFSIVNPQGVYTKLKENQLVDVYEFLDNLPIYQGRFYLKTWKAPTKNIMNFMGLCAISILDSYEFLGNDYAAFDLDEYVPLILSQSGVPYTVDASAGSDVINGWLPVLKAREALQALCFSVNAYPNCAGSKIINISPLLLAADITSYDYVFTNENTISPKVTKLPYVSSVNVYAYGYAGFSIEDYGGQYTIFSETVTNGDTVAVYKNYPDDSITQVKASSTATVSGKDAYRNYDLYTVSGSGVLEIEVVESDKIDSRIFTASNTIASDQAENVIVIKDVMNMNKSYAQGVADNVMSYYEEQYICTAKVLDSNVVVGDTAKIPTGETGFFVVGTVIKCENNLAGGYIKNITVKGIVVREFFVTGKYDDREMLDMWDSGRAMDQYTYPVGYLNTQTGSYDDPIQYLNFTIDGSSFDIGYIGWNDVGYMHIQIDGGTAIDVNTNTGSATKTSETWSSGDLGAGPHTIKMWGGGPGGGEGYILFDYLEVFE